MGRTIEYFKSVPQQMQSEPHFAWTVLTISNFVFFTVMNLLANTLEQRINSCPQQIKVRDKKFNQFLIDVVVVGGGVLIFNSFLSKCTHYPLNRSTSTAIALTAITIRTLFHPPIEENHDSLLDDFDSESPDDPGNPMNEIILDLDENQMEEEKKVTHLKQSEDIEKINEESTPQDSSLSFIEDFGSEIAEFLNHQFHYVNFSSEQKRSQDFFLEKLMKGGATMEGPGDICRAANVPIQAAFEEILCEKLQNGEISKAKVLFLTGIPCTPLRINRQEIDVEKEAEWKKWTVDIRTQTVRALRDAGAVVLVSYCATDYQALKQSAKGQVEFDIYEQEKTQPNTIDLPLSTAVPKELIGALYLITDKKGNRYTLATQGIQIQHHDKTPQECWKMWFDKEEDGVVSARAQKMMNFVQKDRPEVNFQD